MQGSTHMSRQNIYAMMFTGAALVTVLAFLATILGVGWMGATWVLLGIIAFLVISFIAPVVYALVSMEMGYYTKDGISERMRKRAGQESHSLKALLHMRKLGHR